MAQDGNWSGEQPLDKGDFTQFVNVAAEPPCSLDVQVSQEHELTFFFDAEGHVSKIACSCGREGTVEML